jgi:hypothetical protein
VTPSPADRILSCVRGADKTTLQNVLMRMPDKVAAVGLALLAREQRQELYALIARQKAARIEEEIRLESRRLTSPLARARITRAFLSYFGKAAASPGTIWIRPRRKD